ncbi:MAG: hypothetical protein WB588_04605 [Dehalococcoidia bacterium]
MNKAAFLVDGHLEQKFIQKSCPGRPVQRLECNGHNVSLSAIAERIETHCRLFNNRYYPIIVVIDREDRRETSQEISSSLHSLLEQLGIVDTIIIGVTDRTIENWILADREIVNQCEYKVKEITISYEGRKGKTVIKKHLRMYHETTDGVDLLVKCRAGHIKNNSPSFAEFYDQLPINSCPWLNR